MNDTDMNNNIEENLPPNEAKVSSSKLKDYGQKGLTPLVDLLHKYQGQMMPYFDALTTGLRGGADALQQAQGEGVTVAGWFTEAERMLKDSRSKLESGNSQEILEFLEIQASKNPGFMFSASYVAGLFFGRVGRHVGRKAIAH